MDDSELISLALSLTGSFRPSRKLVACDVASALVTDSGDVFSGVCIDTACSLGFCAEHSAVAEMLKSRQSHIVSIVAVKADGTVLPPCGRCRELLWQVDRRNIDTRILLGPESSSTLRDLLPNRYDEQFD